MPPAVRPPILAALLAGLAACGPDKPPQRPVASAPIPAAPVIPPPPAAPGRLALVQVLDIARRDTPGEVIEVKLDEDDDDGPEYELKILTPEGRRIEIKIDARTGAVIEREED